MCNIIVNENFAIPRKSFKDKRAKKDLNLLRSLLA